MRADIRGGECLLWRYGLTFGPGGGKGGSIEAGAQDGQISLIGCSLGGSKVFAHRETARSGSEQAGGLREVPCYKGLLCQSQQALPGDVARIKRCCQGQAVAVPDDSLLMRSLC